MAIDLVGAKEKSEAVSEAEEDSLEEQRGGGG